MSHPVSLVLVQLYYVGGALAAAPEPCARTRAGEPRAWRSRGGAQQRRGGFGTQGVTGVLRDGLSAKRQPVRAGECTTHPVQTSHFEKYNHVL